MKDPMKWFEEAVNSAKYEKDVIDEMKSCISEDAFNLEKFMSWVLEQLEKEIVE